MTRRLFLAASLAAAVVLTGTAQANSPRVSRGDAQAIFQASLNGGSAIRLHGGDVLEGAPVAPGGRISPFATGRHVCALDWHVLAVADLEAFPKTEDAYAQSVAELSALVVELRLDGVPLALDTTAVRRIDPALVEQLVGPGFAGYWEQWGAIMSPTDLAVGAHTLQLLGTSTLPPITFFIDPEGSAACS